MERNTVQKSIIFNAISKMNNHPSAEEVYEYINTENPSISKATVYRVLAGLSENNKIKRIACFNGADRYDYNLTSHCHLLCRKCNRLFDVDISVGNLDKEEKIIDGAKILGYKIIFDGYCKICVKE